MGSKLVGIGKGGDLIVEGTKKDGDELRFEELWMKRIEILESQYDQHVNALERKLLDEKINKRLVTSLREQNSRLKNEVKQLTSHSGGLESKLKDLQANLHKTESKERKLTDELEARKEEIKAERLRLKEQGDIVKSAMREKYLSKKRVQTGQHKVKTLETVVDRLEQDLVISRDEFQTIGKQSQSMTLSLKKAEEEKRRTQIENEAARDAVAFLRKERETDEEQMFRLNQELHGILGELNSEKKKCDEKERQRGLTEKNLVAMRDELKNLLAKVTTSALETRYWKEEAEMLMKAVSTAPTVPPPPSYETRFEQRQKERCKEAELNYRINILERRIATMETEKITLTNQMKSLTTLHKSLFRLYEKNLKERKAIEERAGLLPLRKHRKDKDRKILTSTPQIEKQGKKLELLEKDLFESKRAYNYLRFKLQQKSQLEKNLSHAERTLFRVEREKRECEAVATKAARKLGTANGISTMIGDILSKMKYFEGMRDKLPPVVLLKDEETKISSIPEGDLDQSLVDLRQELRVLERKQAVYQNILAAKERMKENAAVFNDEMEGDEEMGAVDSSVDSEISETSSNPSRRDESPAAEEIRT